MAKRIPSQTICSFCLDSILEKESYSVELKMHNLPDEVEGNLYHTPSCKKCLDSDRIIRIFREPKSKK